MEKLKEAIEKARAQRQGGDTTIRVQPAPARSASANGSRRPAPNAANRRTAVQFEEPEADQAGPFSWMSLEPIELTPTRLRSRRVVTVDQRDNASVPFDVLRARILKAFRDNGWRRLAITSPTKGCGKTFVSVNLSFSFARQPELRTVLIDMDLRRPAVAQTLAQRGNYSIGPWLDGSSPMERHIRRIDDNLGVALNTESLRNAGEVILSNRTKTVLEDATEILDPDLVIYDLPPALVTDDVFNFLPNVDAVLLVAAAGATTPDQIESCEQLFENNCPFLGVVLNKVEDSAEENYGYGYGGYER